MQEADQAYAEVRRDLASMTPRSARHPQQPGDTLPGADHPAVPPFDPDAWRTVRPTTLLMHLLDVAREFLVRPTPSGGETLPPRVVAAPGDPK